MSYWKWRLIDSMFSSFTFDFWFLNQTSHDAEENSISSEIEEIQKEKFCICTNRRDYRCLTTWRLHLLNTQTWIDVLVLFSSTFFFSSIKFVWKKISNCVRLENIYNQIRKLPFFVINRLLSNVLAFSSTAAPKSGCLFDVNNFLLLFGRFFLYF